MPLTQLQARTDVRSLIDEPVAQFWADTEINNWLNQGCAEIQRDLEWKRKTGTITTTASVQAYSAPQDLMRLYRLEFVPTTNGAYTYSLEFRGYNEMDAAWGNLKTLPSAYPENFTLWQNPNDTGVSGTGLQILLYPVPDVAGTLNVYYYPEIVVTTSDTQDLDILPQYDTMVENYAAYRALQKDADPRYKDFQGMFMAEMEVARNNSRLYTDQANWASTGQQNYNPLFLDLEV